MPMAETFDFLGMPPEEKKKFSKEVGVNEFELGLIQEKLGRPLTKAEIGCIQIEWSEHCSYKSSKIYLKKFLPTRAANVVVAAGQDAGGLYMGKTKDRRAIAALFKTETHNHPSFIEPYQGAATGVGGILRDIMTMFARNRFVYDCLRFGDVRGPTKNQIKWNIGEVVAGIAYYANSTGFASAFGDIKFDKNFSGNCNVNVGALGVANIDHIVNSFVPNRAKNDNYVFLYFGKTTDNTGCEGVSTLASRPLDDKETRVKLSAVQDADAFLKQVESEIVLEVLLDAIKHRYLHLISFKDMGGAGLLCSTVEQVADNKKRNYGAVIDGNKIPTSMELSAELLCKSETQERWMFVVPRWVAEHIKKIANEKYQLARIAKGACAAEVGTLNNSGRYVFVKDGKIEVDIPSKVLCGGIVYGPDKRPIKPRDPARLKPEQIDVGHIRANLDDICLKLIGFENVASDKPVYEQYDKKIGNETIVERGEARANVFRIRGLGHVGGASTFGGNTRYGLIDPKEQGAKAVMRAAWSLASVGAYLWGISDNLNNGNPEIPEHMWEFVECVKGVGEACKNLRLPAFNSSAKVNGKNVRIKAGRSPIPVVGGNVSFYNTSLPNDIFPEGSSISPATTILGVGRMPDYRKHATNILKDTPSVMYLVGKRSANLGGTAYLEIHGQLGDKLAETDYIRELKEIFAVIGAVRKGYVLASDAILEAGMYGSLARILSVSDNGFGMRINLDSIDDALRFDQKMFSQSDGVVLQVDASKQREFEAFMERRGVKTYKVADVNKSRKLVVNEGSDTLSQLNTELVRERYMNGVRVVIQ